LKGLLLIAQFNFQRAAGFHPKFSNQKYLASKSISFPITFTNPALLQATVGFLQSMKLTDDFKNLRPTFEAKGQRQYQSLKTVQEFF
jgi:hypothetical protein